METKIDVNKSDLHENQTCDSFNIKRKLSLKLTSNDPSFKKVKINEINVSEDLLRVNSDFREDVVRFRKKSFKTQNSKMINNLINKRDGESSNTSIYQQKIDSNYTEEKETLEKVCSSEDKNAVYCYICNKKISHLNTEQQEIHINRCLDCQESSSAHETSSGQENVQENISSSGQENVQENILNCPICGKSFLSLKMRKVHLKKCAAESNVSLVDLMVMIHHQKTSRISEASAILSKKQNKILTEQKDKKKVRSRRHILEPNNFLDEDLHMAVALSNSLTEESSTDLPLPVTENRNASKKKSLKFEVLPTLLLRTVEENQKLFAARIADIVFDHKVIKSDNNFNKDSAFKQGDSYLWKMTSQNLLNNQEETPFYITTLSSFILPSKSKLRKISKISNKCLQTSQLEKQVSDETFLPTQTAFILTDLADAAEKDLSPNETSHTILSENSSAGFFADGDKASHDKIYIPPRIEALLTSFQNLLLSGQLSDVVVFLKNSETLKVHACILSCRCPSLLQEIDFSTIPSRISWTSYNLETAKAFFSYLYYGEMNINPSLAEELLFICQKYDHGFDDLINHLKELINDRMLQNTEDIEDHLWSDDSIDADNSDNNIINCGNIDGSMKTLILKQTSESNLHLEKISSLLESENNSDSNSQESNTLNDNIEIISDAQFSEHNYNSLSKINDNSIPSNDSKESFQKISVTSMSSDLDISHLKNIENETDLDSSKSFIIPDTPCALSKSKNNFHVDSSQFDTLQSINSTPFALKSFTFPNDSSPEPEVSVPENFKEILLSECNDSSASKLEKNYNIKKKKLLRQSCILIEDESEIIMDDQFDNCSSLQLQTSLLEKQVEEPTISPLSDVILNYSIEQNGTEIQNLSNQEKLKNNELKLKRFTSEIALKKKITDFNADIKNCQTISAIPYSHNSDSQNFTTLLDTNKSFLTESDDKCINWNNGADLSLKQLSAHKALSSIDLRNSVNSEDNNKSNQSKKCSESIMHCPISKTKMKLSVSDIDVEIKNYKKDKGEKKGKSERAIVDMTMPSITVPSPPVTPMPSYDTMISPNIKDELGRFGVRKVLPKKKAIKLLKHIYEETHPWENSCEVIKSNEESQQISKTSSEIKQNSDLSNKCKFTKIKHCSSNLQDEVVSDSLLSSKVHLQSDDITINSSQTSSSSYGSSQSDILEESWRAEDDFSQQDCSPNLTSKLIKFIKSDEKLYSQILQYHPLDFNSLLTLIKSANIKCSSVKLLDFLDEKGITFTMGKAHQRRHRRKKSPKKKKTPQKMKSPKNIKRKKTAKSNL